MHDHHNHSHSHGKNSSFKILILAIILVGVFAVVEAVGGWWANSLALMGDAGHMASDAIALTIAAFAAWIALKPPSKKHSYGFGRAEILAAWISSLLLIAISVAIIVEAISRIHHPPQHIKGGMVIFVAAIGIIINLLVAWILSRGEQNLNMRAAMLHVLSDLLASVAALVSGAVIYYTGWLLIDPVLSILIGIMIMISSIRLLRESILILMEGVPAHINLNTVASTMRDIEGISDIHDLHVWTLSSGRVALSAHINIHELSSWASILVKLQQQLKASYNITHVTLQPEPDIIDCQPCDDKH